MVSVFEFPSAVVPVADGLAILGTCRVHDGQRNSERTWLRVVAPGPAGGFDERGVAWLDAKGMALQATRDGGLVVAGGRLGPAMEGPLGPGFLHHGSQAWLAKFTATGAPVWECLVGSMSEPPWEHGFNALVGLRDGSLLAVGSHGLRGFVAHVSAEGQLLRTDEVPGVVSFTGVVELCGGELVLLGGRAEDDDPIDTVPILVSRTVGGGRRWTRVVPELSTGSLGIAALADGSFVAAGQPAYGGNAKEELALGFDARGERRWRTSLPGCERGALQGLGALPDGSLLLAARAWLDSSTPPGPVLKLWRLDGAGQLVWEHSAEMPDLNGCKAVAGLPDGRWVLAAATALPRAPRPANPLRVLELDAEGRVLREGLLGGHPFPQR